MKCKNCGHAIRRRVFELDGVVMFEYIHAKGGKTCKLITGGKNLPFGKLCGCVEAESESSRGEKGVIRKSEAKGDIRHTDESKRHEPDGIADSPRIPESLTSGEQIEQYVKETMKEALDKIDKKKSVSLTKDEELYVQDSLEDLKAGRFTVSGKNETVKKKLENLKYKLMCWDEIERIHKIIKPMYGKKKTGNPKR